jgi:hypothetical protein
MASVNQTRPGYVNQMGKTHSKPLAARNGRGTAWARHGHGMLCVNRSLEGCERVTPSTTINRLSQNFSWECPNNSTFSQTLCVRLSWYCQNASGPSCLPTVLQWKDLFACRFLICVFKLTVSGVNGDRRIEFRDLPKYLEARKNQYHTFMLAQNTLQPLKNWPFLGNNLFHNRLLFL